MKALDEIDRKLIALLQDDARTSMLALAKAVQLSRSAVQERLSRLESSGVISQYTVRLGKVEGRFEAWLMVNHAEGYTCDDLMPLLTSIPAVRLCHSLAGGVDLMVLVETASPAELAELRERILMTRSVASVTTSVVLRSLLDRR
jgi:Lrp/AsnC family transcriptional regulator, leucine-responsive regulatory protein